MRNERGRRLPQLDDAWRLSEALGVTLDEMVEGAFEQERGPKRKRPRKKGKGGQQ